MSTLPTVFHVTHVKSGSQWVYNILEECAPERIVKPRVKVAQFYEDAIQPGMIYPTVYVPQPRFEATLRPTTRPAADHQSDSPEYKNWRNFVELQLPIKVFFVMRDLRDTLVSLYFSLKVSHAIISDNVAEGHRKLNEMDFEDGLMYLCNEKEGKAMHVQAGIQSSWLPVCQKGNVLLVRYEDMIADETSQFEKICEYCELGVHGQELQKIIKRHSFVNRAGRKPGEEDISSHYRKGISGDWRNYFTDRIKMVFKQEFGQHLIETGYEKDLNW